MEIEKKGYIDPEEKLEIEQSKTEHRLSKKYGISITELRMIEDCLACLVIMREDNNFRKLVKTIFFDLFNIDKDL